jgi:hypothetical protein
VLLENGLRLPDATSTVGYHLDRVRRRTIYNVMQSRFNDLGIMMRDRRVDDVAQLLAEVQREIVHLRASSEDDVQTLTQIAHTTPGMRGITHIPELISQCEEAFNDLVRLHKALLPARRLILD